jgi:hypothetical protein
MTKREKEIVEAYRAGKEAGKTERDRLLEALERMLPVYEREVDRDNISAMARATIAKVRGEDDE